MLQIAHQRFTCQECGRCCRRFLVPVTPLEIEAIAKLPWPPGECPTRDFYCSIHGHAFFRHDAQNGDCVYLDEHSHCRMHAVFGAKCKALSCRAYPFEFLATFPGEVTAAARYDCPAVLANSGHHTEHYRSDLEEILQDSQLHLGKGFTAEELDGLTRESILVLCEFLRKSIFEPDIPVNALRELARRLERLGRPFVNDVETLKTVLPSMRDKALRETPPATPGRTWPERIRIRSKLLNCLRYDCQTGDFSWRTRLRQATLALKLFTGHGNPNDFDSRQPDSPFAKARIFDAKTWSTPVSPEVWDSLRRCLATRLESLQFFGRAYYGATFFKGLDELLEIADSALALARLNAAATHLGHLEPADGDYAVALIDHCHGKISN
ncbi:MAG: YkgJ family cysteine cluster protein [Victivallales bacterium]|nr:YkgJ family cysteine cluster protein [Victivallales bacterium]